MNSVIALKHCKIKHKEIVRLYAEFGTIVET